MITFYVTYPGQLGDAFDKEYWIEKHLPLVRATWSPYGLINLDGFFPSGEGGGYVAICACVFRDEAAVRTALAAGQTKNVMDDVKNFTQINPEHSLGRQL